MRALLLALVLGCGGAPTVQGRVPTAELDPVAILLAHAENNTDFFAEPEQTIDQLKAERRNVRGAERRALLLRIAVAHLYAAAAAELDDESRDARRHRRDAQRRAQDAAQGSRDDAIQAKSAFVELWNAWRGHRSNAARLAERFTTRHRESGPLLFLAWIIRGEIELEEGHWREAERSYRYVLGQLEHPLYAFALLRTAHTLQERERGDEARDMITQVVEIGCHGELTPELELTVEAAANELQVRLVDGRPLDCSEAGQGGGEDEVPPGFE